MIFPPALASDGAPLDQIRLAGITAVGWHGVGASEKRDGQPFSVDLVLHLDVRAAARGDDLSQTVNYADVAQAAHEILGGVTADLIETVAERIAAAALENSVVVAVDVCVHKPRAPIPVPFDDVAVAIRRDRAHRKPVVGLSCSPELPANLPTNEPKREPALTSAGVPLQTTGVAAIPDQTLPEIVLPGIASPDAFDIAKNAPDEQGSHPQDAVNPISNTSSIWADVRDVIENSAPAPGESAPMSAAEPNPQPLVPRDRLDLIPDAPVEAVLGLGANLGDAKATLRQVVAELGQLDQVVVREVGPLAKTRAVGGPDDQPDYLNTVVIVVTTLSPRALWQATSKLEAEHGRIRAEHWGPRTIDIDLVAYGDVVAAAPDLTVPHPRASQRAFVLVPWAKARPDAILPGLGGGPVAALAATAPDASGIRWLALDWLDDRSAAGSQARKPGSTKAAPPSRPVPAIPAASGALPITPPPSWDALMHPGSTG